MPPKRKRRQYGSGGVHYRTANGRWYGVIEAGYTASGGRRRVTVSAKTEAKAKQLLRDRMRQIEQEGAVTRADRLTVKAAVDLWLPVVVREVRPSTYANYASSARLWLVETIGHIRVCDLTPAHIRRVDDAQRAAGRTSTTIRHTRAVLGALLKFAEQEGARVPATVKAMKRPDKAHNDRDYIPTDDALAIIAQASYLPHGSRWVAALLQGLRQGECLGLTWDAIDPTAGELDISWQLRTLPYLDRGADTFRVPDGYEHRRLSGAYHLVRPKTSTGWRKIPLIPGMAAALEHWRATAPPSPHGLVWPTVDGHPKSGAEDRREWQAIQRAAGVTHPSGRPYVVHEARNTTATLLRDLGVDESIRVQIMGHSSITVTRGYQGASTALAREALERVAERLGLTS